MDVEITNLAAAQMAREARDDLLANLHNADSQLVLFALKALIDRTPVHEVMNAAGFTEARIMDGGFGPQQLEPQAAFAQRMAEAVFELVMNAS